MGPGAAVRHHSAGVFHPIRFPVMNQSIRIFPVPAKLYLGKRRIPVGGPGAAVASKLFVYKLSVLVINF